MKRVKNRPILLVVVLGLAVLASTFGLCGVAPAQAYDPMSSGIKILIFDDDQVTLEMQDGDPLVIGDLNSYSGGVRCEILTGACTGDISLEYRDGDRLVKIDLTFVALDPDGNESLVTTFGTHESLITNQSIGSDVERTSGTFRATFNDNRDGTLGVMIEFPNGEQSHTETITFHLTADIGVY
jgi:hypothetical protein